MKADRTGHTETRSTTSTYRKTAIKTERVGVAVGSKVHSKRLAAIKSRVYRTRVHADVFPGIHCPSVLMKPDLPSVVSQPLSASSFHTNTAVHSHAPAAIILQSMIPHKPNNQNWRRYFTQLVLYCAGEIYVALNCPLMKNTTRRVVLK